jgi:hypothetical protein
MMKETGAMMEGRKRKGSWFFHVTLEDNDKPIETSIWVAKFL